MACENQSVNEQMACSFSSYVVDSISSLVGRDLPEAKANKGHLMPRGELHSSRGSHCDCNYVVGITEARERIMSIKISTKRARKYISN